VTSIISLSFVEIFVVYMINKVGLRALPCGTPASIVYWLDVVALHLTTKTYECFLASTL